MSADSLSSYWIDAGNQIGFRVEAPHVLRLSNGQSIQFAVRLPDFGGCSGMLLSHSFDAFKRAAPEIVGMGYGYSVMGHDLNDAVDRESVIEVLRDWGWAGSTQAPDWLL